MNRTTWRSEIEKDENLELLRKVASKDDVPPAPGEMNPTPETEKPDPGPTAEPVPPEEQPEPPTSPEVTGSPEDTNAFSDKEEKGGNATGAGRSKGRART